MSLSPILSKLIDDELSWREAEMSIVKAQLLRDVGTTAQFRCSYRAFLAITYCHYEAFSKILVAQSVADIELGGTTQSDCIPQIQEKLFVAQARKNIETLSNSDLLTAISTGASYMNQIPYPPAEKFLGISNLSVVNLKSLIACLGLPWTPFAPYAKYIATLVDLRHQSAHGQALTFDSSKTNREIASDVFVIQAHTITVMHLLATLIVDMFEQATFVKSP